MTFTNINDPAGLKSLLEQLRSSQAWQDTVDQSTTVTQPAPVTANIPGPSSGHALLEGETLSVASLLSQLQSSSSWSPSVVPAVAMPPSAQAQAPMPTTTVETKTLALVKTNSFPVPVSIAPSAVTERQDLRSLTFQHALPHLARLSDDPNFVSTLSQMKHQQNELERRLWDERHAIQMKHEEKVRVALAKAKILGGGLSQHEATMLSDAYRRELAKFDTERVLVAWDGLIAKQQIALEKMQVPTMFITDVKADRERQQSVVQVLEGIAGNEAK